MATMGSGSHFFARRGGELTLARPERFELPTYCSGGNRSIQLSYGRAAKNYTRAALTTAVGFAAESLSHLSMG
jgi:hypothetical protein